MDRPTTHSKDIHTIVPMTVPIILASGSQVRAALLRNAGVPITVSPARVDEDMIKAALLAEDATPRDVADALAESKARKIAEKTPEATVIGCDQVLAFQGRLLSKPETPDVLRQQLSDMRGRQHKLLSAVVLYRNAQPNWRTVGEVRLTMHDLSDAYIDDYVTRHYDSVRHCVGGYKLEEEGARLFSKIEGDYFTVLGLPLLDLLSYLVQSGELNR